MKNIFLLDTNKPSRLCFVICTKKSTLTLFETEMEKGERFFPQNIYITNDEEIKKGDWVLFESSNVIRKAVDSTFASGVNNIRIHAKKKVFKIILTTDESLIADGVKAIDDEFLEWFVKNPSCEEVKVNDLYEYPNVKHIGYKIIIPKEEPKQEYEYESECICDGKCREFVNVKCKKPKQETLEEALKNELEFVHNSCRNFDFDLGFKTGGLIGAKWQAERMYSEEEVISVMKSSYGIKYFSEHKFLENLKQFKKKA